jgi:class 3 adenylate cyclase
LSEQLTIELEKHQLNLEEKIQERTKEYEKAKLQAIEEKKKLEEIMRNVFPKEIAEDLQTKGYSNPVYYKNVTLMFIDFVGFTKIVENLSPKQLIDELSVCYVQFDKIMEKFGLEKLKTIGDAYMCACGLPKPIIGQSENYAALQVVNTILAALEILDFINILKFTSQFKNKFFWGARIGIHSGSLVAGVIGEKRFAYDVWGDTVNLASRMESNGEEGKINVSHEVFNLSRDFFDFEPRGEIETKNKGKLPMYFVLGIKKELSKNGKQKYPNQEFWNLYNSL